MSATSAPFGFRPAFHPSGLDRAIALANGIASGYSTGILKNQPVALNTSGVLVIATAGSAFQGVFAGVEYTDASGRRQINNQWPANTAYQTGSCVAYYYSDPLIVYEVQVDATLAQTSIGDQANMSNATAGSTTTGLSAATLSATLAGSSAVGDFRILDIAPYADNAWGDAFPIVRVQVSRSQFVATINAI
jgi:hypothetical protein